MTEETHALITSVIEDFIRYYELANPDSRWVSLPDPIERRKLVIDRINAGECGNAALALAIVLETKDIMVTLYDNYNHAYFSYGGVYFDTAFPYGNVDSQQLTNAKMSSSKEEVSSLSKIYQTYTTDHDHYGHYLINGFLRWYGIVDVKPHWPEAVVRTTSPNPPKPMTEEATVSILTTHPRYNPEYPYHDQEIQNFKNIFNKNRQNRYEELLNLHSHIVSVVDQLIVSSPRS